MKTNHLKLSTLALALATTFTTSVFADGFTNTIDGFTNNSDGTVTDTKTGLIWQACAVGQNFNASTGSCDGKAATYKYEDALKITSNFGGQTDWRVPTIAELLRIVDLRKVNPSINKSLFPNPPADEFWSSSSYADDRYYAWNVNFDNGGSRNYNKNGSNYVRLVRGSGDSAFSLLSLSDFVDNKDGTVTNKKTGLTWQRCAVGQSWSGGYCDGKAATYKQEDAIKLTSDLAGQTDWHLPSLRELLTIVDYSAFKPATNLVIFPDAPSNAFWTTTPRAEAADNFWYVDFDYGQSGYTSKKTAYSARLVRGTLSTTGAATTPSTPANTGGADLTPSITANQSSIPLNQNLTYTASVSNAGTGTANNVSVLFMMPPRWTNYVSVPSDCSTNGAVTTCSIGSVNANANVSRSMTVNFSRRGATSVGALVKSNDDTNDSNNMSRVVTTITK